MNQPRIIFCLRRDYVQLPAGDIIQMERWRKILQKLGCQVTTFSGDVNEYEMQKADIVFIWHLERLHESLPFWQIAKNLNKKVWLVPTCWSETPDISPGKVHMEECKLFLRRWFNPQSFSCGKTVSSWRKNRQRLLRESDMLLVNSDAEKQFLLHQGAPEQKLTIIPNTIDINELDNIPRLPWKERSGIIHVGHFCPRKNQMQLIRQLHGSGVQITFIGTQRPMHKIYYNYCRTLAGNEHKFPGSLPHQEVLKIMGRSRLCISNSLSETPGLSNLEAAMLGCNLILPDISPVREYFGENVTYVPTQNITEELLFETASTPPSEDIRNRIINNYTELQTEELFRKLLRSYQII